MSDSVPSEDRMATKLQLPAVLPFTVTSDQTTLWQRWSKSVKGLEYFLVASNITDKKQRGAVPLHLAGPEVRRVFETLSGTGDASTKECEEFYCRFGGKCQCTGQRYL